MRRRIRTIRQSQPDECGPACVAMIANFHGHALGLAELRTRYAHVEQGPSLASLIALGDALGLDARPLRLSLAELPRLSLPAVLHWEFRHFVVLEHVRRRSITICDPASGRRRLAIDEAGAAFTGVGIEFGKRADLVPERGEVRLGLSGFLESVDGLGRVLGILLLLMLVSQLLALAVPVGTQLLIDEVVLGRDAGWLLRLLAGIGLLMLAGIVLDTLRRRIALDTGISVSVAAAAALVGRFFRLPVRLVERRTPGDLLSRLESMRPVERALTESLLTGTVQLLTLAMSFGLMLAYSTRLAVLSLAALLLTAGLQASLLPGMRRHTVDAIVADAEASQSLIESLRGFDAIRSYSLGPVRIAHWRTAFEQGADARTRQGRLAIVAASGQSVIAAADQLLFLGLGVTGVASREITLGTLFAMVGLRTRLQAAALVILRVASELFFTRAHLDRVSELLVEAGAGPPPGGPVRGPLRGSVRCRNLCFGYPGREPVLDAVDIDIGAGERVVICGASGAGKTTLLRLLLGELEPCAGSIDYDDYDLALWNRAALGRAIGIVRQRDSLLAGTLADNLCCFEPAPDAGRLRAAAQVACIWDEILALPMKLDTPIRAGNDLLSGGQRQRLLLARALYRQPRMLFLDEATSELDSDTETRVLENLAMTGATIVSVAHGSNAVAHGGRLLRIVRGERGRTVVAIDDTP